MLRYAVPAWDLTIWADPEKLQNVTWEIAEHNKQHSEKLAKVTASAVRNGWIAQMAKGELCEKQPRFTDNCGEYLGKGVAKLRPLEKK